MFVWMAKFGAALGVRTGIHVGVDVFVKQLSPTARKPVIVFATLCGALFTGIIGTLGAIYVYELDPDQVSPELEWPSWMIYLCIPLGSYLMSFRFLQVMYRYLKTGYAPHAGHHGLEYEAPVDTDPGSRRRAGTMSGLTQTLAPRPRAGEVGAWLIVLTPVVLALVCALARFDIIELSQTSRARTPVRHAARR